MYTSLWLSEKYFQGLWWAGRNLVDNFHVMNKAMLLFMRKACQKDQYKMDRIHLPSLISPSYGMHVVPGIIVLVGKYALVWRQISQQF